MGEVRLTIKLSTLIAMLTLSGVVFAFLMPFTPELTVIGSTVVSLPKGLGASKRWKQVTLRNNTRSAIISESVSFWDGRKRRSMPHYTLWTVDGDTVVSPLQSFLPHETSSDRIWIRSSKTTTIWIPMDHIDEYDQFWCVFQMTDWRGAEEFVSTPPLAVHE